MRALLLLPIAVCIDLWIRWQVKKRTGLRQPIATDLARRLRSGFIWPEELLDRVRLIPDEPPVPGIVGLFERWRPGIRAQSPAGITFGWDVIVRPGLVQDELLLFHELIHVVQWARLGRLRFLLLYADGLLRHGYLDSPLESIAYQITAGYAADPSNSGPVGHAAMLDADTEAMVFRQRSLLYGLAWWLAGAW